MQVKGVTSLKKKKIPDHFKLLTNSSICGELLDAHSANDDDLPAFTRSIVEYSLFYTQEFFIADSMDINTGTSVSHYLASKVYVQRCSTFVCTLVV